MAATSLKKVGTGEIKDIWQQVSNKTWYKKSILTKHSSSRRWAEVHQPAKKLQLQIIELQNHKASECLIIYTT